MVWLGITRKGLGLLSKTKKAKKIKEVIRAKVVNEIFQGKKYKYAGNLWKAKQRALPENVKKSIAKKQEKINDMIFSEHQLNQAYKTSKKFGSEKKRAKGRYFTTFKGGQN
jgi:hypothetical protein